MPRVLPLLLVAMTAPAIANDTPVVAAARELGRGAVLDAKALTKLDIPAGLLRATGAIGWERRARLVGRRLSRPIAAGALIPADALEPAGAKRPALEEGLRTFVLRAGVAAYEGRLAPGDRIDVLARFRAPARTKGTPPVVRTLRVLTDLRVEAVDGSSRPKDGPYRQLTLHLDMLSAMLLTHATKTGSLRIVRRGKTDRVTTFDPEQRIQVHDENAFDLLKIADQLRLAGTRRFDEATRNGPGKGVRELILRTGVETLDSRARRGDRFDLVLTRPGSGSPQPHTFVLMRDVAIWQIYGRTAAGAPASIGILVQDIEALLLHHLEGRASIRLLRRHPDDRPMGGRHARIEIRPETLLDYIKITAQRSAARAREELGDD